MAAPERAAVIEGGAETAADAEAQAEAVAVALGLSLPVAQLLAVPQPDAVALAEAVEAAAASPCAPLGVACGAVALAEKGALATFAAVAALSGVTVADALPSTDADAEALAGGLWLVVALGVELRLPLELSALDADAVPVEIAQPVVVLDGVLPCAREGLGKPLLRPLREAARSPLSVCAAEVAPDPEKVPRVESVPAAEREALALALEEPLPQAEDIALERAVAEPLPQGLPLKLDAEVVSVATWLIAASEVPAAVALFAKLAEVVGETIGEAVHLSGEPLKAALALSIYGDCDRVGVAGSDPIWEAEGVVVGCAMLLPLLLLLLSGVLVAVLVAAVLTEMRALTVAASKGVELSEVLGSAVAEGELGAELLAVLLAQACAKTETRLLHELEGSVEPDGGAPVGVLFALEEPNRASLAVAGTALPVAPPLPLSLLLAIVETEALRCGLPEADCEPVLANKGEAVGRSVVAPVPLPAALPQPLLLTLGSWVTALVPVEEAEGHADPLGGAMLLLAAAVAAPLSVSTALPVGECVALLLPLPAFTEELPSGLQVAEAYNEAEDAAEVEPEPVTAAVAVALRDVLWQLDAVTEEGPLWEPPAETLLRLV